MSFGMIRLYVLSGVFILMAGCGSSGSGGSGGGGGTPTPTTVTVTFSGATPTAVATQIGSSSYTAVTPASSIMLTLPSGTTNYAVAVVCPEQFFGSEILTVEYVTLANTRDGTAVLTNCPSQQITGQATLQVNAAAIQGAASVWVGGVGYTWSGSTVSCTPLIAVGTQDVPVIAKDNSGSILAIRILHNQTIPGALNGGNPVVFDASDETMLESITYNNLPSGYTAPYTSVRYNGPDGNLKLSLGSHVSAQYRAMPSSAFQNGGYYNFTVVAGSSTLNNSVGVTRNTTSGGPQVFNLPAPWSYAGPTAAALPIFNFDYQSFSGMPNVVKEADMSWETPPPPHELNEIMNEIMIEASPNYQGGATSLSIPDLSGLNGFLSPAPSGTSVSWGATIYQGIDFSGMTTPTNGTWPTVDAFGSYTEP